MSAITAELKTELLGILAQERKEYETILSEKAKGIIDPIRQDVLKKLEDRYDELEAKFSKPTTKTESEEKQESERIAKLWGEFMRKGQSFQMPTDAPQAFKDITTSPDPAGGYLMPTPTVGRIVSKVYETTPMRQFATVETLVGDTLEGLVDNDEADSGWVSETGTRAVTGTPELGKYKIEAHEQYANARISQKGLDDLSNVESWLVGKIGNKFARTENRAYFQGTGVGQPQGICSYATSATEDDSRAWGIFEHIATAQNGAFPTSNPADTILSLIERLKAAYRPNARFFAPRRVFGLVRKFKTTADAPYLWEPSLQVGAPARLAGYPIIEAEDMPALATGSLSMAFGDMAQTYTIVDRLGMRMLRDPFSAKPYVLFYAVKRTGGGAVNFESLKFVKFGS
jgi:HK97 family phage major capsid protein